MTTKNSQQEAISEVCNRVLTRFRAKFPTTTSILGFCALATATNEAARKASVAPDTICGRHSICC